MPRSLPSTAAAPCPGALSPLTGCLKRDPLLSARLQLPAAERVRPAADRKATANTPCPPSPALPHTEPSPESRYGSRASSPPLRPRASFLPGSGTSTLPAGRRPEQPAPAAARRCRHLLPLAEGRGPGPAQPHPHRAPPGPRPGPRHRSGRPPGLTQDEGRRPPQNVRRHDRRPALPLPQPPTGSALTALPPP